MVGGDPAAFGQQLQRVQTPPPGDDLVPSFLPGRTTSDCSRLCAAMEAASSSMPLSGAVRRTLPSHAVSLFRGMDVRFGMVFLLGWLGGC
jgi:hypothetical protein